MAEVFGVITGAISVGSLAIQIFDSIQKLHEFCNAVQDVPRDFFRILEELELLGSILIELENDSETQGILTEKVRLPSVKDPLDYCRRAAQELNNLVIELSYYSKDTKIRRKWAAVKAVLKKDRVVGIQKRLESAKSMLNLAISCASLKLQRDIKNSTSLLTRTAIDAGKVLSTVTTVESLSEDLPPSYTSKTPTRRRKPLSPCAKISQEVAYMNSYWTGIGWYINRHIISQPRRTSKETISRFKHVSRFNQRIERIFLPLNFIGIKGFSVSSNYVWGNWQYTFRSFRIVPDTARIFELCESGSIDDVLEEIESGTATLFDTSSQGHTLLHIAAAHAHPDLCLWLLNQGIPSDSVMLPRYATALHLLVIAAGFTHAAGSWADPPLRVTKNLIDRPSDVHATVRILIEHGHIDPMQTMSMGRNVLHVFSGPATSFEYLLEQQQHFAIDTHEEMENGSDILEHHVASISAYTTELIHASLGKEPISGDLAARSLYMPFGPYQRHFVEGGSSGFTLLHAVLWRITHRFTWGGDTLSGFKLASELIDAGADIHAQTYLGGTPLDHLLDFDHCDTKAWTLALKGGDIIRLSMGCVTEIPDSSIVEYYERDRGPLLLKWLDLLRGKGISLHEYARREQEQHPEGVLEPTDYLREGIQRVFEMDCIPGGDDIIVSVKDVEIDFERPPNVPGSWVPDQHTLDYYNRDVMSGTKPSANWRVNTAEDLPELR